MRDTRRFARTRREDAAVTVTTVTLRRYERQPWPKCRTCLSGNAIYTTPTVIKLAENFQFLIQSNPFYPTLFAVTKFNLLTVS